VCRAFATGARLDLAGDEVPAAPACRASLRYCTAAGQPHPRHATGRGNGPRPARAPGATVSALVELTGCTFDEPIDLYAADLAGWRLARCALPGLQAANLRVRSELALDTRHWL
jgi:hypothetical protein